jgi:hypothetical protein
MATYYSPKIITDGLVLCLDAGNNKSYPTTGTAWNDLSGNNNTGTLTNGPVFSATNGGSIVFDGVDDKVTFPNTTVSTTSGITVDLWFKTSSGTKYQDIFDMADAYGVWIVTNYAGAGTGKIVASFNTVTGYMSANYAVDTWYAVTLAGTGSTNFLYINGTLITTGVQAVASSVNFNAARIGNVDGDRASEYFIGNVASLKFYNKCLSASEVLQNYNATKARFGL